MPAFEETIVLVPADSDGLIKKGFTIPDITDEWSPNTCELCGRLGWMSPRAMTRLGQGGEVHRVCLWCLVGTTWTNKDGNNDLES